MLEPTKPQPELDAYRKTVAWLVDHKPQINALYKHKVNWRRQTVPIDEYHVYWPHNG